MQGFYSNYLDILETVEDSIEKGRLVPVLILVYSAIDSFSGLAEKSNRSGRGVFKDWVKQWMLSSYPLPCNENDLYAARCGLLHSQTSESDSSIRGSAKELFYSWGNANFDSLKLSIENSEKKDEALPLKIEDLIWSFRNGMADCLNEIEKDIEWRSKVEARAKKMFINL